MKGLVLAALALGASLGAQARDERSASVGMRARIEQIVVAGPERVPKPVTANAPLVLRVIASYPHGSDFRYDLEYSGLEPGTYDLAQFLQPKAGGDAPVPAPIEVRIVPVRAPGQVVPNPLTPRAPPQVGGYRDWLAVACLAWVLGLGALVLAYRKRRASAAAATTPVTLADRLRPMVQAAAAGRLDEPGKAELERLLLAFWRRRLQLDGHKAGDAVQALRAHPEAGALLRQLEDWLHRPEPPAPVDVAALLAPYRDVAADAGEVR